MAGSVTHSLIKASGGDYTGIVAWYDDIGTGLGTSTDLVTDDFDHKAWVAAEEFDGSNDIWNALTTDSTHKIFVAADSNGATTPASGHSGTKVDAALMDADRALAYNTSFASFLCNSHSQFEFDLGDDFTEFSRLQFDNSATGKMITTTGSNVLINRCLFDCDQDTDSRDSFFLKNDARMFASIVITVGSNHVSRFETNDDIVNVTFVTSSGASISKTGTQLFVAYGRPDFENCAFFSGGAGSEYISDNGSIAYEILDFCSTDHSDLTAETGEGSNNTYSLTATDQFTAIDNTDWRLKSGNGLDQGTDKTGTVVVDIFGNNFGTVDQGCEAQAAGGSAALAGTAISGGVLESEIVAGGETIIITLTGDTWVAAGATFDAQRQNIIDGLDSAQSEAAGWNAEVRDKEVVGAVVRTSDTVVTVTLTAAAAYVITADETITVTVPATALVTSVSAIVATPTFDVTNEGVVGRIMSSLARHGGLAHKGGIAGARGGLAS